MSPAHDAPGRPLAEEEAKHRGLTQKPSEPDPTDANRSGELRPVSVPSLTQPQDASLWRQRMGCGGRGETSARAPS
jgi:hypothetical protein